MRNSVTARLRRLYDQKLAGRTALIPISVSGLMMWAPHSPIPSNRQPRQNTGSFGRLRMTELLGTLYVPREPQPC
jgi:hypothetical protein